MPHAREMDLSVPEQRDKNPTKCHLMPCSIEHNQIEVKVREYFEPTIRELKAGDDGEQGRATKQPVADGEILMASFRGRPLMGKKAKVPEGYIGHVIGTENSTQKVRRHFDEFIYWNWDQMPDKNDAPLKALNWLKVAKSIHDTIE